MVNVMVANAHGTPPKEPRKQGTRRALKGSID